MIRVVPTRAHRGPPTKAEADQTRQPFGAAQVRSQNSTLLLRLLWAEQEISRADLARRTGLSRSTISAIVADLLDTGLVREARTGESRGGRKPILLAFDYDAYSIVGIDVGATHVSVAVTNLRGEVRAARSKLHAVRADPAGTLALARELVDEALEQLDVERDQLLGIGVSAPSPVDPTHPGKLLPLILPKWADVDVVAELGATYGVPVFLDNDANLGALAEVWWGGHPPNTDLAYIKIGLGVGAGLIVDGRIHRGRHGTAGEMGHTALDPSGPRCVCGLNGCINTLIGTKNLLHRVKSQLDRFPDSLLRRRRRVTLDHLVDAALADDPLAIEVLGYAGRILGIGVANLLNLLAPEVVVLGGSVTRVGDKLVAPLEATVSGMSLAREEGQVRIEISALGEHGIALGAATLALEAALDDPQLFTLRRLASA